ncbi:MAG: hypothetical protein ACOYJV_07210, partial [Aminivibrio sp.]
MNEMARAEGVFREEDGESVKYIRLDELSYFRGRLAEDILSDDGALLLPRGSDIATVMKSM